MLGSLINRFRVVLLFLALGMVLAGQGVANGAAMENMQQVASPGMVSDSPCPGCPGDQHGGMASACCILGCWTAAALPAHSTPPEPMPRVAFAIRPDVVIAGIATAPDPYPPRSRLPA
jgi:hypothetical protein